MILYPKETVVAVAVGVKTFELITAGVTFNGTSKRTDTGLFGGLSTLFGLSREMSGISNSVSQEASTFTLKESDVIMSLSTVKQLSATAVNVLKL